MSLSEWNRTMQIEPYDTRDSYRVWLSDDERELLLEQYDDDPQKQLALQLGLCGLRADEVTRVATTDIRELEADREAYKLEVPRGKTGHRETPIPADVVNTARIYANAAGTKQDAPLVDVTTKTIRRWVRTAADQCEDRTGVSEWEHVTSHDLRRTWATTTYYRLNSSPVALDLVLSWGGWTDESTFRDNYLGKEPDQLAAELMDQARIL